MKTTLITLLATLLVSTLPSVSEEPGKPESGKPAQTETAKATLPVTRTVTDTKGRTMEGTILSKSDTAIKFRRASDNKEFEINIDTLSDADKTFVAGVHTPQPPAPIPLETQGGSWTPHYGTYALFRVEDTIYAIYATGIDGERPDMKRTPGDDCYYSIQYSVTKITPDRPNQIITKTIAHEPPHESGVLNCGKFKLLWRAGGHYSYRIGYGPEGSKKAGPPPGTEYYNLLLPTLDSIKDLDPNRWMPVPTIK